MSTATLFVNEEPSAPGEFLSELLDERGMTQADLARRTGLSQKHISQLVTGDASLSPTTALLLERVTGMPAHMWSRLEANYQTYRSRQEELEELDSAEVEAWVASMPVQHLVDRGHIEADRKGPELAAALLSFLGLGSVGAFGTWMDSLGLNFRPATGASRRAEALATWLRICDLRSQSMHTAEWDKTAFTPMLSDVADLSTLGAAKWWPALVQRFASAGVALLLEPEFKPETVVNGASWWRTPRQAVLAVSGRRLEADGIQFTILHEAAHLLKHSKKKTFVNTDGDIEASDSLEEEANRFAQSKLIPDDAWSEIELIPMSPKSKGRILDAANSIGVHPGIVLAQLTHRVWVPIHGQRAYGIAGKIRVREKVDLQAPFWREEV